MYSSNLTLNPAKHSGSYNSYPLQSQYNKSGTKGKYTLTSALTITSEEPTHVKFFQRQRIFHSNHYVRKCPFNPSDKRTAFKVRVDQPAFYRQNKSIYYFPTILVFSPF